MENSTVWLIRSPSRMPVNYHRTNKNLLDVSMVCEDVQMRKYLTVEFEDAYHQLKKLLLITGIFWTFSAQINS